MINEFFTASQVEIHRNGINANNSVRTYYALNADTRSQITGVSSSYSHIMNEVIALGYDRTQIVKCF